MEWNGMEKRDKIVKRIYNTDVDETHFHTELTLEEQSPYLFLSLVDIDR
jgi:hypothetical protein